MGDDHRSVDEIKRGEKHYHDRDLWGVLRGLEVVSYTVDETDDGRPDVSLEVDLDNVQFAALLDERSDYLRAATGEDPLVIEVIDSLVNDIARSIHAEFDTVGHQSLPEGLYQKHTGNDTQWKALDDGAVYDDYSDLLWELTGEPDDDEFLSVPGIREDFLEACVESDDHSLPRPGEADEIIKQHIKDVKAQTESRTAVHALKQELEKNGVDARTASAVAQNVDDDLFVSDAEIEELD